MHDLLSRRSRRGRAVRLAAALVLGLLCAQALTALALPLKLRAIPIAALLACLLMLPRHPDRRI